MLLKHRFSQNDCSLLQRNINLELRTNVGLKEWAEYL